MKKTLFLFITILALLLLSACSEKDNNPLDTNIYGYSLDQFIDKAVVTDSLDTTAADSLDFRNLYNYEIVSATDGFSPRNSSYAGYDLGWNAFRNGYIVPSDGKRTWFSDASLPGAFRVRNTGTLRLYRKVEVSAGAKSTKTVELKGLTIHQITNWNSQMEDAIKLSDLVQGIAAYDSVKFVAFDNYTKYYSAAQIADGYYLLNSEVTTFPTLKGSMLNNMKKFRKLATVEAIGAPSAQAHSFALADSTKADVIFTVPDSFNGFTSTVLTDYAGK
ncbi:MAG: hypothetical protein CVU48_05560 [Candidatus Cloacimonetes bacterium HGW-Cloacimonetes-1]|nr:MAG: hypothetical protein CVU48_05560 [Candidatus Cloacimonetes bacterium HGW-Cloacimonetes-1]